ncbi:MAG: serine/threonine protein kinase [Deltaproteobacteria bacterium]|nr:serine/threonine protein kinase [Deltaproteobacteria bacterium]
MSDSPSTTADGPAKGLMVTPRVRLVRLLGRGGMGSVWVAEHLTLNTEVAVKFITASLADADPSLLARFEREARVAAQIKSPHVVQTYDHGVMADGTPFIVMELLEGESLGDRLKRAGPLTLAEADLLVRQTTEVLARAHELGVVHRDIKPDNLYCIKSSYDLFIKVLDFGIAKQSEMPAEHGMTRTGAMLGTPYYMSPEQVTSAKHAGPQADLWALTVATYEALIGEVPFNGETLGALCIAIATAKFTPATVATANLPRAIDFWFARALNLDPEQRYANAKEYSEAFSAAVKAVPVPAEQPMALEAPPAAPAAAAPPTGPPLAPAAYSTGDGVAPITGDGAVQPWGTFAPGTGPGPGAGVPAATGPSGATFTGAASTLDPPPPQKSRAGLVIGGVLLLAALAGGGIFIGRLTSGGDTQAPQPADTAEPAASATEAPTASTTTSEAVAEVEPTASASATASATASAVASASPPATTTRPAGTGRVQPKPTKPNCEGNNALKWTGKKYVVRPECLR